MDSYVGFEVGAEVELIEDLPVLEDSATITVENKEDLPAWHHLHYVDESSSDESLDNRHVFLISSEDGIVETPTTYMPEVKTEDSQLMERKMFSTIEGLFKGSPLNVIQSNDQSVVWSNVYNVENQGQPCSLEETEVSHMEIVPASNSSPSPTQPAELYSEIPLAQEEDEAELYGKYSFYNAKTQSAGTVKPWVRSHKCEKCGRQFGRLYNLESHMCIKTALTRVNVDDIMSVNIPGKSNSDTRCEQSEESMNRLEKMCAEAQKELHNLKGLYKREDEKPLIGSSVESLATPAHVDGSVLYNKVFKYKQPITCDRCGRRFRSMFNLECHVCWGDKNMSAPQNTIVTKPNNPIATDVLVQSDQTIKGQDMPSEKSESLDNTKEEKIFKCQYCGKVYTRRASYGTHLRWHMRERDLICSVNKSLSAGNLGPLLTTIDKTSVGLKKKTGQMFACQECGRIFNKQCSYSTHVLWHVKRRNLASALASPSVNQAEEGLEVKTQEAQVTSVSATPQGSDDAKAVSETYICPECPRVFYKRIAYANHTRWHMKERELALSVKAATQAMGYQVKSSKGGRSKDTSQGYCNLVKIINKGEQQHFYVEGGEAVDNPPVEPGQQKDSTEVPEFVFELEVGTETFHEGLASKTEVSEVSAETASDVEETSRTQTSTLTSTTKEPNEIPPPVSQVKPNKLLGRRLKRRRQPHRCRDCGTCFSQYWKLKSHQYKSTIQRSRRKKYKCDCGRHMVGLLHYLRHQLEHLSDTAFICAVCGKLLKGYRQLRAHSWVHPLVSQFHCKCGALFTQLPKYLWHCLLNKTRERRQKRNPKM